MKTEIYRKPKCPYGKKAIKLLNEKDIDFDDHIFEDKEAEEKFKKKHDVKTTPQIFMNDERVGGYSELAKKYGVDSDEDNAENKKTYRPIIAIFYVSILLTLVTSLTMLNWMGFFLVLLAVQKLTDLKSFKESFANYDLITAKLPVYGYIYPFAELLAGLGFIYGNINGSGLVYVATVSVFIGFFGAVSITKAVYIDKRDLNCACVGGNTNVPLGFVSFSENAVMFLMGLWVLTAHL